MIVKLYVTEIVLGKRTFDSVPDTLKPKAAELLRNMGCEHLIPEGYEG